MKVDLDSISSMKFLTKIPPCLIFSGLILILLPALKASARPPSAFTNTIDLNIDYEQCAAKATQAANIVLTEVNEPSLTNDGIISFFGHTQTTQTTLMCIQNGQNSIFVVVSNGDDYQGQEEAKSVRDRFMQVMSSN